MKEARHQRWRRVADRIEADYWRETWARQTALKKGRPQVLGLVRQSPQRASTEVKCDRLHGSLQKPNYGESPQSLFSSFPLSKPLVLGGPVHGISKCQPIPATSPSSLCPACPSHHQSLGHPASSSLPKPFSQNSQWALYNTNLIISLPNYLFPMLFYFKSK